LKLSDLFRLQGSNIGIIGYAQEAMYKKDNSTRNLLIQIIAEAQKANALISRYDPKALVFKRLNNTNQIKLFKDIIAQRR
jgi:hypothetical protein